MNTRFGTALFSALLLSLALSTFAISAEAKPRQSPVPALQNRESQAAITPAAARARLEAGNRRFVAGTSSRRELPAQIHAVAAGQYPFATILSCMDSRTSPELLFDLNLGDAFAIRVAGNIVDEDILGSMEYGAKVAGSKLIAVVGHSSCGAIKGACDDVQLGNVTALISKIKPAVEAIDPSVQPRNSKNHELVEMVARKNVLMSMAQIREKSPLLREMIDSGKIGLVGGMYDLESGKVEFFDK